MFENALRRVCSIVGRYAPVEGSNGEKIKGNGGICDVVMVNFHWPAIKIRRSGPQNNFRGHAFYFGFEHFYHPITEN